MADRVARWSLRRRLALITIFAMLASLAFGGLAMYWAASLEADQMRDAQLEQLGATVHAFVENDLRDDEFELANPQMRLTTRPSAALLYRFQVWSGQGELMLRSHEAPADRPFVELGQFGFANVRVNDEEYRVFSLPARKQRFVVQVAENVEERWRQVGLWTAYYVGFLLIPLGLVCGAAWLMAWRSFHTIESMADQLSQRSPLESTPLRAENPPRELLPVLSSIDALLDRVGNALSAERRFTSLAAHEIRTPLAGLMAQVQLAGSSRDGGELQEALGALKFGIDRVSHLVDQLLDLAHVEALPIDHGATHERVNLSDLYHDVMADLGPRGLAKELSFGARFDVEELDGHRFALSVLLRNLLANAIIYSPAGGRVEIRCETRGERVVLTIDDAGRGIRPADRERAFERFNRLGQSQSHGVGLGLSIVLSVVKLHGAKIQLIDSPLGGLRVQVLFPPAEQGAVEVHRQAVHV